MSLKQALLVLLVFSFNVSFAKAQTFQHFKKVVWVVFENENYSSAVNQADFARVAKQGAFLTNYTATTHPSQGNYISMIAGSNLGVRDDNPKNLPGQHVGDLLEKANLDWRVYAEDYPGNCFLAPLSGMYVRKHVPFLSFTNVSTDKRRCGKITNSDSFKSDLANGTLPELSMFIPNLKNDGHNTGLDFAGNYLTSQFGDLFSNPAALKDVLFIVTFDEDDFTAANHIYTVLIGSQIKVGAQVSQPLGHASMLKMIEDEFGIGNLGRGDSTAAPVVGIWK